MLKERVGKVRRVGANTDMLNSGYYTRGTNPIQRHLTHFVEKKKKENVARISVDPDERE